MSGPLEHRDLRTAIEFAVLIAEEANKGKRSLPVPAELRAQFGVSRIPTAALGRLRRAIESDDVFRRRIAAGAVPELVDPIGLLWLQRPTGWEQQIDELLVARAAEEDDADLRASLRRAERRRAAAEQVAARSRAEVIQRDTALAELRTRLDDALADVAKADEAVAELRSELVDVRNEARHARDREAALRVRLDAVRQSGPPPEVSTAPEPSEPSEVQAPPVPAIDLDELGAIATAVRELGDRLDALAVESRSTTASTGTAATQSSGPVRRPIRLPGGVIASSAVAAEFLLRSDAAVVVDGYNVAMLGWPGNRLEEQRRRLLDALENAARRFGADVTVVFDGAAVVGAHADRRRMVRVAYSPAGVTADDVIRDEVRRLPVTRSVVVVTNDAEIVNDVRALGANVVPSNALLAIV
ncbi:MAG TPA: NYN domain-containing protein [Ilumatobacteraceae bacterium]|nr:NYN domain-containing protein [Ilumatobacteraceae bacterium]